MSGFAQMLNQAVRDVLGTVAGEGLSFHSLRHSLATDLKASGCPVGTAQEILGHSSGSISYDLYGGSASADVVRLAEALAKVR
ncbi:MAG: tyrosine-type recombinase/integrase [Pseudomonas putida]